MKKNYSLLFGKKLFIHYRLEKRKNEDDVVWNTEPCNGQEVIIIGKRILKQGRRVWEGEDVGYVFDRDPEKDVEALLVVSNMKQNPFFIPMGYYQNDIDKMLKNEQENSLL